MRRAIRIVCSSTAKGAPDDWIERRIYSRHRNAGIIAFIVLQLLLFGVPGIIIVAVQMLAMPVLAAGVINGFGHGIGYRNYEVDNASRNIIPWGLFIGGEELHNNHHAFPSSAKFSIRPWELDVGWLCVVVLRSLGLAKVKRVAPRACVIAAKQADDHAAHAVIRNRMHVLRAYATQVIAPVLEHELGTSCPGAQPAPPESYSHVVPAIGYERQASIAAGCSWLIRCSGRSTIARSNCGSFGEQSPRPRKMWQEGSRAGAGELKRAASRPWRSLRVRCGTSRLLTGRARVEEMCWSNPRRNELPRLAAGTDFIDKNQRLAALLHANPPCKCALADRATAGVSVGLQGATRIPYDQQD